MARIGILIGPKGRGSNMLAIVRACAAGQVPAQVGVVIAPKEGMAALDSLSEFGVATSVVSPLPAEDYGDRLLEQLRGIDWICLAGYLRLLPDEVLRAFPDRILNIHPALLPEFGGKGMYGMHVHQAVIAAGKKESGATIHLVNEQYDEGRILLQRKVPVLPDDTPEALAARVLVEEHQAYAEALRLVLHD